MCLLFFVGNMNISVFNSSIVNNGMRRYIMKNIVCFWRFRVNIMKEKYDKILGLVVVDINFYVLFFL